MQLVAQTLQRGRSHPDAVIIGTGFFNFNGLEITI